MTYPPNGPYDQPANPVPGFDAPQPSALTQPMPLLGAAPEDASHQASPPAPPLPVATPTGYGPPPPGYPPQVYPPQDYPPQPPAKAAKPAKPPKPPKAAKPRRPPLSRVTMAIWTFAAISMAGIVLGLTLTENNVNAWHSVHAWGAVAIVAAAATAAPALGAAIRLSPTRAWQVAAAGAGVLVFFWILFVLASVGSNTSLLLTVGVVAGVIAAWLAPGRSAPPGAGGAHSAATP